MSKNKDSLEVEIASLHQPVHLPGFGATDRTLNKQKLGDKNLKMHLLPQGLSLSMKGRKYIIPHAAIGCCMLKDEELE